MRDSWLGKIGGAPWSRRRVVLETVDSTTRLADKIWIARYFLGRSSRGPATRLLTPAPRPAGLGLKDLAGPLHVSPASGGLATYYEIVRQQIYAPIDGFAPRKGEVVVDVGANVGVFSLWAAHRVGPTGRVLSVEPTPIALEQLQANLRDIATPATVVPVACGDLTGLLTLHYPPGRLSVASVEPRPDRTERVEVPVRTLADVVRSAGIDRVDFLKVDVEGLELEVLRGAGIVLQDVRRLALEVDVTKQQAVEQLLQSFGLRRVALVSGMWGLSTARVACFARDGEAG